MTAGNASCINDGAAAVVLVSGAEVATRGLRPRGRLLSWAVAGVPPEIMGIGPAHAVPLALQRAGIDLGQIDVIESKEAFAAQAIAVNRLLDLPLEKVNPNGGAVALGHAKLDFAVIDQEHAPIGIGQVENSRESSGLNRRNDNAPVERHTSRADWKFNKQHDIR